MRLTESGADKQLGDALRVVVLLVFEDVAGRHLLLHLPDRAKETVTGKD